MRLHEQLGGPEPDDEVEALLADQRRQREEGADALYCPDCQEVATSDGERCSECLSARAEDWVDYYREHGGQG